MHSFLTLLSQTKKVLRTPVLAVSLFYLSIYIPLLLLLFFSPWYSFSCNFHERCERFGCERTEQGIVELTRFFRHQGDLTASFWSAKEKTHMDEVRGISDKAFALALFMACALALSFKPGLASRPAVVNGFVILAFLAVIPVFSPFWMKFHMMFFDNQTWFMTRKDFSWYLLNRVFFAHTIAVIIGCAVCVNFLVWLGFRKRKEKN